MSPLFPIAGQSVLLSDAGAWFMRIALSEPDIVRVSAAVGQVGGVSAWVCAEGILAAPRIAGTDLKVSFPDGSQASVTEILNPDSAPAICFLRVAGATPPPIELAAARPAADGEKAQVGVVGYAPSLVVAPGEIQAGVEFRVDCATGAFLTGAPIVSLENGRVIGMWSGEAMESSRIREAMKSVGIELSRAELELAELESAPRTAADYTDRMGYNPEFLRVKVPLPKVKNEADVSKWKTMGGASRTDLPYTNFSVVMSVSRKLPIYTVSNVDGAKSQELKRENDRWLMDPRIDSELQAGPKVYKGTHCDKGHMVRRLDPVWGRDALLANEDTFHYTNACPQHRDLNRKVWNDLEDYILMNAEKESIRVSVFTGPVFAKSDPPLHGVKVPVQYWKLAAMITKSGQLSVTAYILSQAALMNDLETAADFTFGAFKTFQVTVARLEKMTGLDFGNLRNHDPLAKTRGTLESAEIPELASLGEIVLEPLEEPAPLMEVVAAAEWADLSEQVQRLTTAIKTFNRADSEIVAKELADDILRFESPMPDDRAPKILLQLRGNCYFDLMEKIADALITTGQGGPKVRRQYAQALIDQGKLSAPQSIVKLMAQEPATPKSEKMEAIGLNGRIFKQLYVNRRKSNQNLQEAFESYHSVYEQDKDHNLWHGINVVALAARAQEDQRTVAPAVDYREEARRILAILTAREEDLPNGLDVWDTATALEACVALGDAKGAVRRALDYISSPAGAFELASTTRQLEEIWRVGEKGELAHVLPILKSQMLRRDGAAMTITPESVRHQLGLEKVFGSDASKTLKWYQLGLERCKAVARMERAGKGFGTGWLVRADDFFPGEAGLLILTNAHVIAPADAKLRRRDAAKFNESSANFQVLGAGNVGLNRVRWYSPVEEFDATFLVPEGLPAEAKEMPISPQPVAFQAGSSDAPPRLYIIGHPSGRDVELSLQDNYLLAMDQRRLHYRTPTEPGNSGSPVFDANEWRVVALHHAGSREMLKLDGSGGTYEANEGISILALREATRQNPVERNWELV